MLVDLKSKARRTITVQLPMSMESPRFPAAVMSVRRSRSVKLQAEPVGETVQQRMPPVLTIRPGETVKDLPKEILRLDPIAAALHPSRRELVVLREHKPPRPVAAPIPSPAPVRSEYPRRRRSK